MYRWNFGTLFNYTGIWWRGIAYTLGLSAGVVLLGTILGVVLVVFLKAPSWPVRLLARLYVDVFRSMPALVLIGTIYFCVPILTGITLGPISTSLVALSLNLAPFAA